MELEELIGSLEKLIEIKAKQASIPGMEWEDVAQELRIIVWKKHDKFINGKSSPKTFGNRVFNNRIKNLYRDATKGLRVRNWVNLEDVE